MPSIEMHEFQMIAELRRMMAGTHRGLVCGIGDDCAVVEGHKGWYTLLTTDAVVENVHFDLSWFGLKDVGVKALATAVSDIAAMGGIPQWALVGLSLPVPMTEEDLTDLYSGILEEASRTGVVIVGGDITRTEVGLGLTLTVAGEVEVDRLKLRSGARVGDVIAVTGELGLSAMGLELFRHGFDEDSVFKRRHLRPVARIKEGRLVSGEKAVGAMIDVSDGLLADVRHIIEESNVGGCIEYDKIPRDAEFDLLADELGVDAKRMLLAGGEDYELLITVQGEAFPALKKSFHDNGCQLHEIGKVTEAGQGLKVIDGYGGEIPIVEWGYEHF